MVDNKTEKEDIVFKEKFSFWINLDTGKKFKYSNKKGKPNGNVKKIKKEDFMNVVAEAEIQNKPFDISCFPTLAEIDSITSDAMDQYKVVTDKLIENTRMYEVSHNQIKSTFDSILAQSKNLNNTSGPSGLKILRLIQSFFNAKDKIFSRYDTVRNKLDELNNILKEQIQNQYKELSKINELEECNYKYIQDSKRDIKIIQGKILFCTEIFNSWPAPNNNEEMLAVKKAESIIHSLRQREEDTAAFVTISQQAMIQNISRKEIAEITIQDSKRLVNFIVPRHLEAFINSVIDKRRKVASNTNKNIKDEWNRITQQNSENLKNNYVSSLEDKYSHLVTEDTLLKQSNDMIEMIMASKIAHEKSLIKSNEYMQTLKTVNESIVEISKRNL